MHIGLIVFLNFSTKIYESNLEKNAPHLEGAHFTLVCLGTPVEKHWLRANENSPGQTLESMSHLHVIILLLILHLPNKALLVTYKMLGT